ncbi:MAG: GNAT family N-acetyltransferase [Eubacteriales bacterium]
MIIRDAVAADAPRLLRMLAKIAELHRQGRPDLFREGSRKYDREELLSILSAPDKRIFVADEGGEATGYLFCMLRTVSGHPLLHDERTLYIDDLFVEEAYRGQQMARALMDSAGAFARANGCRRMELNVWAMPGSALPFYEKYGMREMRRTMEMIL